MAEFDQSVDFLIIGSGAGAMAAGLRAKDLGLETLLVEKSDIATKPSELLRPTYSHP
jgi:3-oxosteroid 1-dehydrogenase